MMIDIKLHEKLRNEYNPNGSYLREHQLKLLSILSFIDRICSKNNIKYWLASGTCLGAVRHNGFIPWDDDIDIEMTREDYMKFKECLIDQHDFCLQEFSNDLFYLQPFSKLRIKDEVVSEGKCDKYYKYKGAFIDIFIMEETVPIVSKFFHLLLGSLRHFVYAIDNRIFCGFFLLIIKPIIMFFINCFRPIGKVFIRDKRMRYTYGTGFENLYVYPDEVFPLSRGLFEGRVFPIPKNFDIYLRRQYGDYMTIPTNKHNHNITK